MVANTGLLIEMRVIHMAVLPDGAKKRGQLAFLGAV